MLEPNELSGGKGVVEGKVLHRYVSEYIVAKVGGGVVVINGYPLGACVTK
jgi:hypothetical protein